MLIAEQLMLLCIDPAVGEFESARNHVDIDTLAAAALLFDLAEQKRLRFKADFIAIDTNLPISHPLLSAAIHALDGPGMHTDAAIDLLVARLGSIPRQLLESLFRRDVLHRVRASWWPWSPLRYPLRSLQARNEAIAQIQAATVSGDPSLRGSGLMLLADFAGRLTAALGGATHETAAMKLLDLVHVRDDDPIERRLLARIRSIMLN